MHFQPPELASPMKNMSPMSNLVAAISSKRGHLRTILAEVLAMFARYVLSATLIFATMIGEPFLQTAQAGDLRIALPKRATTTPVQQLNREGVKAVNKHHVDKAKKLFYQAYLLDPDDPFTLNNLGYISELEGARATERNGSTRWLGSGLTVPWWINPVNPACAARRLLRQPGYWIATCK